jgi:hypothetical protein
MSSVLGAEAFRKHGVPLRPILGPGGTSSSTHHRQKNDRFLGVPLWRRAPATRRTLGAEAADAMELEVPRMSACHSPCITILVELLVPPGWHKKKEAGSPVNH